MVNEPIEDISLLGTSPHVNRSGCVLIPKAKKLKSIELDQVHEHLVDATSETTTPSETDSGCVLSRRQKKNKSKKGTSKKKKEKPNKVEVKEKCVSIPLANCYGYIQLKQSELYSILTQYVLLQDQLLSLGFPVERSFYPDKVIIYRTPE